MKDLNRVLELIRTLERLAARYGRLELSHRVRMTKEQRLEIERRIDENNQELRACKVELQALLTAEE